MTVSAAELARLEIEIGQGTSFLPVRLNMVAERRALLAWLAARYRVGVAHFTPKADPIRVLISAAEGAEVVVGLGEEGLLGEARTHWLRSLNTGRDHLDRVGTAVLLFLDDAAMDELAQEAPDLWSVRAHVVNERGTEEAPTPVSAPVAERTGEPATTVRTAYAALTAERGYPGERVLLEHSLELLRLKRRFRARPPTQPILLGVGPWVDEQELLTLLVDGWLGPAGVHLKPGAHETSPARVQTLLAALPDEAVVIVDVSDISASLLGQLAGHPVLVLAHPSVVLEPPVQFVDGMHLHEIVAPPPEPVPLLNDALRARVHEAVLPDAVLADIIDLSGGVLSDALLIASEAALTADIAGAEGIHREHVQSAKTSVSRSWHRRVGERASLLKQVRFFSVREGCPRQTSEGSPGSWMRGGSCR